VVRRRLDEIAGGVPAFVGGLAESLGGVRLLRPGAEGKPPADDPARLEQVDEVVEPVDEKCLDAVRLARELVAFPLLDGLKVADEVEECEAGGGEEIRAVGAFQKEPDIGLVLERLPGAYGKTQMTAPRFQREYRPGANQIGVRTQPWLAGKGGTEA
jgi:hypothetical protein